MVHSEGCLFGSRLSSLKSMKEAKGKRGEVALREKKGKERPREGDRESGNPRK